jgi:DNA ligase-1
MTLYQIIKALQQASGSNAKLAILKEHKDNELLKAYLDATLNPKYNYYITEKTFPNAKPQFGMIVRSFDGRHVSDVIRELAGREITGNAAKNYVSYFLGCLDREGQELYKMMLLKDIKASVGITLVNKVWDGLIYEQPYQRCSLPKDANLKDWPWEKGIYSQVKADGMYVAGSNGKLVTRAGNEFPKGSFPELEDCLTYIQSGMELNGELLVTKDGEILPRKTGNGMLNSVMQGEQLPEGFSVVYQVWDYQDLEYPLTYSERYDVLEEDLSDMASQCIKMIESKLIYSLEEASNHFQECLSLGLEGTVLKHPEAGWKDGKSKYCVKYKVEAELDLEIYDVVKGSGKYSDCMGAIRLKSSCGKLLVDCGSGFNDAQRKAGMKVGSIVTIKANDIVTKEGSDTKSLFLPIFIEERYDKTVANSLEEIEAIFEAVKGIK